MVVTRGVRQAVLAALVFAGLLAGTRTAGAQYFGQNKVQYEKFGFEVIRTEHFDIYYYPEEKPAVEYAVIMAERWYARLSRLLNHDLSNRQPLILYASGPHFRQTNTLQGDIGEATGGVTEILKRRIVLPFAGPLAESDHVLGHELVHAFQFDMTGEGGGIAMAGIPGVMRFPLWFVEGMAEYLSVGPQDPNTAMWMRDAVREGLPDAGKLSDPRYFPYRFGHSLWAYVAGVWGDDVIGRILQASRTAGSPAAAFARVLNTSPDSVVAGWHRALKEAYSPLFEQTQAAADVARPLMTKELTGGRLNVAPALSPDGKQLVFLSERNLFSIDMFLARIGEDRGETKGTAEVVRKLTKTDVDPHFESIQFINSAGAWDLSGQRFVFGAISKGRPVLTVVEMPSGGKRHEVPLGDLGEVYNPSWSPDGRYVVFSGLVGGLSDLFIYDLQDSKLKRLTNDAYADLQPVWSPDGRTIAFVSDRFSTGLASLLYGTSQIALIDPESGAITKGPGFDQGKHTSPQWSPDGTSLYFVSDQSGIPNVYRAEVTSGTLHQVTNLYTGVSGIASLSPALSVAAKTGQLAFSVYEKSGNAIYYLDRPELLAGGPVRAPFEGVQVTVLPPSQRASDDIVNLLGNAFYGLPEDTSRFARRPYRSRFALDYVGQPSLAVGADAYGTYIAGGASLFWSDMLGNHNLATGLAVQGTLKDIAALVGYTNLTKRLNWGVVAQQYPYLTGYVSYGAGEIGGVPVLVEDRLLYRQTSRSLSGMAAYPLSRVQRIELSGGVLNVSYDLEQRTRFYDLVYGTILRDSTIDLEAPSAITMGQASVALVYDNSLFGVASPLIGQRYRLELSGNVGSLDFFDVVADFRKYVMPVRPFTLAARLLHFGRYGPDAEDAQRMQPMFIGYDGLVRGYNYGSFDFFSECPRPESPDDPAYGTCPAYTNLFGSKMLVGNLELRFPPLGVLGIGRGLFGFLPIEMVVFGDAGLAWWQASDVTDPIEKAALRPFFLGGNRKPVFSAGTGLRMNVFGLMIVEFDWVYPFNRERGGYFQFGFMPGF